jgi:hypothetical protein
MGNLNGSRIGASLWHRLEAGLRNRLWHRIRTRIGDRPWYRPWFRFGYRLWGRLGSLGRLGRR